MPSPVRRARTALLCALVLACAASPASASVSPFLHAFGAAGIADVCLPGETCVQGAVGNGDGQLNYGGGFGAGGGVAYVTDPNNYRVVAFNTSTGAFVRAIGYNVDGRGGESCTSACHAGSYGTGAGYLQGPTGVAVSGGEIFVAESYYNRISVFDAATGAFKRALGANVGGSSTKTCTTSCAAGTQGGAAGQMNGPDGIAVVGNDLYVADSNNYRIDVFNATDGTFERASGLNVDGAGGNVCTTTCQAGGGGAPVPSQLGTPIALTVSGGEVFVTTAYNARVDVFDASTGAFKRALGANVGGSGTTMCTTTCGYGTSGSAAGQTNYPEGVAVIGSEVFVGDSVNHRIDVLDSSTGAFERIYGKNVGGAGTSSCTTTCSMGQPGGAGDQYEDPLGLSVADDGNLLVFDRTNQSVRVIDPSDGSLVRAMGKSVRIQGFDCTTASGCSAGAGAGGPGEMSSPAAVATNGSQTLVADTSNNRIDVFDTQTGAFAFAFGRGVNSSDGSNVCSASCRRADGNSLDAGLQYPHGIAVSGGEAFASDYFDGRVDVFDAATGAFKRALGKGVGNSGAANVCTANCSRGSSSGDGSLSNPTGIAVGNGLVYVQEPNRYRVSVIDATTGAFQFAFGGNVGGSGVNTCTTGCANGTAGSGPGQLGYNGQGLAFSNGEVFVSEQNNNRVSVFDAATGAFKRAFGKDVGGPGVNVCTTATPCVAGSFSYGAAGAMDYPEGIFVSGGEAFVTSSYDNRVNVFDPTTGAFKRAFGKDVGGAGVSTCTTTCVNSSAASTAGALISPSGIAISSGKAIVADTANNRISVFDVTDTTAPTTTDNVPATYSKTPVTVTLTADDGGESGVAATYYTTGASPATPDSGSTLYDPNNKPVLQSGEKISYFSVDNAGNAETPHTSSAAQVDAAPPNVTDNVPAYPLGQSSWTVTLTANDGGGSGLASIKYLVGANPADPSNPANSPLTYNPLAKPVLGNGQRIRYYGTDAAGNAQAPHASAAFQTVSPTNSWTAGTVTTGTHPYGVAIADLNGDGRPDMATVNSGTNSVSVLTQQADHTFVASSAGSTGSFPNAIAIADFNGDGVPDIATTNYSSNSVTIFTQASDHSGYTTSVAGPTGTGPEALAVADFNGDGLPDVVTVNSDKTVTMLTQSPAHTFSAASIGSTPSAAFAVAVGDLNGDGLPDIAAGNSNGSVTTFLQNSDRGGFTSSVAGTTGSIVGGIAVGDLNADGLPDIATANEGGNVSVLTQQSDHSFTAGTAGSTGSDPQSIALGDINGDGRPDLVTANYNSSNVTALTQNADHSFSPRTVGATGAHPWAVAVGDVTGDGLADIAVANSAVSTVTLLSGALDSVAPATTDDVPAGWVQSSSLSVTLTATDAGGSGVAKTYYTTGFNPATPTTGSSVYNPAAKPVLTQNQKISYFSVDNAGNAETPHTSTAAKLDPSAPASSDDIPTFAIGQTTWTATISSSDTGFSGVASIKYLIGTSPGDPTVAANSPLTYDPANKPVLAPGQRIRYYATDAAGNAQAPRTSAPFQTAAAASNYFGGPATAVDPGVGSAPFGVAVGDLNGDGHGDMVLADYGRTYVSVLIANSDGSYTTTNAPVGTNPRSVAIGDLNGDGRPDIAVANYGSSSVTVLTQNSDGTFTSTAAGATGTNPLSVAIADLNGDGRPDIVTADTGSSTITRLIQNANGTYTASTAGTLPAGSNPWSLAIGDLNRDGRLDIAVATYGTDSVSVLTQASDGSFTLSTAATMAAGAPPMSVAIGDLNGDGRPDIVTSNYDGAARVLAQNGDGTYTATVAGGTGGPSYAVAISDLNGDGRPDIALTNDASNAITVLRQQADGTYATSAVGATGTGALPRGLAIGDVNGDGRPDIAVANYSGHTLTVLSGGADSQAPSTTDDVPSSYQNAAVPVTLTATDNGSGVAKTYYTTGASPATPTTASSVYNPASKPTLNNGEKISYFSADNAGNAETPHTSAALQVDSAAPVSSDDVPSFAVGQSSWTATLNASDTGGSSLASIKYLVGASPADPSVAANLPQTYDPLNKPLVPAGQRIRYYATDGAGNTSAVHLSAKFQTAAAANYFRAPVAAGTTGLTPIAVAVGDVNGDGRPDIATANNSSNSVTVLTQNVDGTYASSFTGSTGGTGSQPRSVAIGDVNGDGHPDLVTANNATNNVTVFTNNNDGSFTAGTPVATGASPFAVALGDINGDGRLDIVTADSGANTVSILTQASNGTFARTTGPTGQHPIAVAIGDVNADGRPDIVTANQDDSSASLLLQSAGGSFPANTALALAGGSGPYSVAIGDLNGDGRADLATANATSNNVTVIAQNSNGSFTAGIAGGTGAAPRSVAIGDLNGDGRVDLATADVAPGTSTALLRNAGGTYDTRTASTGTNPQSVAVADMNGDGRLDIVTSNTGSTNVTVTAGANDTTAPATTDDVTGTPQASKVTVTLTPSDSGSGVDKTYYTVGTSPATPTTSSSAYDPAHKPTLTDGQEISYFSTDKAGNVETPHTSLAAQVTDATAPTTTDDVSGWANHAVTVTLTPSDTGGSGVDKTYYTTGTNPATPTTSSLAYDPADKPMLADGEKISYFSSDNAGNAEAPHTSAAAQIETTAPSTTDDVTSVYRNGPVTVTLSPSDTGGSGVDKTYYTVGADPTATTGSAVYDSQAKPTLGDGEKISYLSVDHAGNAETAHTSVAARVDTQAPTSSDDVPTTYRTAPVTVTLTATDTGGSGVKSIEYLVGADPADPSDSANSPLTYDSTDKPVLHDGEKIRYFATDNAGNAEAPHTSRAAVVQPPTNGLGRTDAGDPGTAPASALVYDLDKDGLPDLAFADATDPGSVVVLTQNADGSYTRAIAGGTGPHPTQILAGDVSGDGLPDLVTANDSSVTVLTQQSDGSYSSRDIATGAAPRIALSDLDGDGDLDIVVDDADGLSVLGNDGSGGLASTSIDPSLGGADAVVVTDVNRDGKPDIVVLVGGHLVILTANSTGGGYTQSTVTGLPSGADMLSVADLDGDGQPDFVVGSSTSGAVAAVIQDPGGGTFTVTPIGTVSGTLAGVSAADLDGDGKADPIVITTSPDDVAAYYSDGSGGYTPKSLGSPQGGPQSVVVGDLNGDGRNDVIVGTSSSADVFSAAHDTAAPTTTDDVPSTYVDHAVTVTLTAADTGGSGVDKTYYTKGADPSAPDTSSAVYDSSDKPTLADGEKIRYFSVDGAGNAEAEHSSPAAKVDLAAPSTTDDVPSTYVDHAVTVTLRASDTGGSGVDKTYYTKGADPSAPDTGSSVYDPADKPTLGDGEKIRYFSVDQAGNAEAEHSSPAAKVDLVAPSTTDDVPSDYVDHAVTVTLTAADTGGSGVDKTYYTKGADPSAPTTGSSVYDSSAKPTLADGEKIRYFSVDQAGNAEAEHSSAGAKVDTAAPATTDDVPSVYVDHAVTVTLTAADTGGSGVDKTYYTKGADPSAPETGSWVYDSANKPTLADGEKIRYFSVDGAGNAEAEHSSSAAKVDTAAPTTTDDVPSGYVDHAVTVTLSAADTGGSGVDKTYYTKGADPSAPDTGSSVYDSTNKPTLADGEKIRYFSVDQAGNAEAEHSSSAAKVDTAAPSTTDDVPSSYVDHVVTVTLSASDTGGSGVDKTYYTKGADPSAPTTGSSVYDSSAKPTLADGEKIRYFSVDQAGNAEAEHSSSAAKVDTAAPSTTDDVPSSYVDHVVTVTLSASDTGGSGVEKTYYTKGADPSAPDTSSSVYDSTAKPTLADGEKIRYFSVDGAGNAEAEHSSSPAKVDTAAPTTTDDVPSSYVDHAVTVTLSASDTGGSGVDKTYYTKGADPTAPDTGSSVYDSSTKPTLGDGEKIRYFTVDNAGNTEAEHTSSAAKVDTAAPTTTDDVPSTYQGAPVTVTLSASDTGGSGIDKTYYTTGALPAAPDTGSSVYDSSAKPTLANGEKIRYFSVDNAGNAEAEHSSAAAKVATDTPVTTDDVPSTYRKGPVSVTLTATDAGGSGIAATHYTTGVSPAKPSASSAAYDPAHKPTLGDGERIRYYSVDNVGHAEADHVSAAAKVDTTAPVTTDDVPATAQTGPVTVTLTATDTGSGVDKTYYTTGVTPGAPDSSSTVYDPAHKPTLTDGQKIRYFSVDTVGNAEIPHTSAAASIAKANPPVTPPATTPSAPPPDVFVGPGGTVETPISCPAAATAPCKGEMVLRTTLPGGKTLVLGSAPYSLAPGQKGTLTVPLTTAARRLLAARGADRLRGQLVIVTTDASGKRTETVVRTLTLGVSPRPGPRGLTAKTRVVRGSGPRLHLVIRGRLKPAKHMRSSACADGQVRVTVRRQGKTMVTRTVRLSSHCTYRAAWTLASDRAHATIVRARFMANLYMRAKSAHRQVLRG